MNANYSVILGDSLERLRELPDRRFHCAVTSPPYWSLREYHCDGQIGQEKTIDEWVARLVEVFAELRRVLRDDATFWLNCGDSYTGGGRGGNPAESEYRKQATNAGSLGPPAPDCGLAPKNLIGQAWRLAFALQAHGWILRSDIIWHKRSPMPESVTDRPTRSHEYVFLFSKQPRYFYDAEAVREQSPLSQSVEEYEHTLTETGEAWYPRATYDKGDDNAGKYGKKFNSVAPPSGRNLRSVWSLPSEPIGTMKYPLADGTWKTVNHFAAFPTALPERCIRAGTSEKGCCETCGAPWRRIMKGERVATRPANTKRKAHGENHEMANLDSDRHISINRTEHWEAGCKCDAGIVPCRVIDPFSGAASTGVAAIRLGREYTGIELNEDYAAASLHRLANPDDFDTPVADAPAMELFA